MPSARPLTLAQIIPADTFLGISLILREGDRFLYGIRPAREGDGGTILELTGIGGGLEEEDESLTAGANREALEEIGCRVILTRCPQTLVVRSREEIEQVTVNGEEKPAAVVFRYHRTPPHQPWHHDNQGDGCLVVFDAVLDGQPRPSAELPQLVWLKLEQIMRTAHEDVPLSDLLDSGAILIGEELASPPESYLVRLTDSQEALVLALGDEAAEFYRSLCRT